MSSIDVKLFTILGGKMKFLKAMKLPSGVIPMKHSHLNTKISKDGIYYNSEYLVEDVIYEYVEKESSTVYAEFQENKMSVQLVVTLINCETNAPVPEKKEKAIRKVVKKTE